MVLDGSVKVLSVADFADLADELQSDYVERTGDVLGIGDGYSLEWDADDWNEFFITYDLNDNIQVLAVCDGQVHFMEHSGKVVEQLYEMDDDSICRRQPEVELTWSELNVKLRDLWLATERAVWQCLPEPSTRIAADRMVWAMAELDDECLAFVRRDDGFAMKRGDLNAHLHDVLGLRHIHCLASDEFGVVLQLL